MNKRLSHLAPLFSAALLVGCAEQPTSILDKKDPSGDPDRPIGDSPDKPGNKPEDVVGGEDNTFDHMPNLGENDARDPYEIAKQREEEGSPEVRSRLHSCQKLQIQALRNMLADFGVDLGATGNPPTAGQLLDGGGTALGQANYAARMGEDIVWTAAGAAKQFDIFVQASPVIIQNMPSAAHCQVDGVGAKLFDENGKCQEDGITCLIGRPATPEHLVICQSLVDSASTPENGQNIAVAALLSAAHSCE